MNQSGENNPFEYESAFSLILSLQEQVKHSKTNAEDDTVEALSEKFSRLSKLTVGELEFARRMGFDQIPCIRLSPYPILWNDYDQPVPMDFIIKLDSKSYCVDVKYYDWKKLQSEFILSKTKLSSIGRFRDYHSFDGALIALKRFEKWYLFDISDLKRMSVQSNNVLKISFTDLEKINKLKEKHIVFNTGAFKKPSDKYNIPSDIATGGGIYVNAIKIDKTKITFPFSTTSKATDDDLCEFDGLNAKVLIKLHDRLGINMNAVYKEFNHFSECDMFTDSLPTAFSLTDAIQEVRSEAELRQKCLNSLTKMKLLFHEDGDKLKFYYHRLYAILTFAERKSDRKKSEIKVM